MAKKLGLKQRYALLTRGLDWETSYQPMDKVFPEATFEGIKIKDWDKWQDPFRLTMDAYWKFQSEKERKLYAVLDSFAQNNGQMGISEARYLNAVKLFLTGVSPLEYQAHRGFAHAGRQLPGVGPRIAAQMQSLDELRHAQTQIHTISHYNKFFDGLHDFAHMHDRLWYLSVPKAFFDDARTAGPFEFMIAIGFAFEYVLTNLLFVPFMSGAAYNGDMATVTFGFSAQSDESRHMTLGIEVIKFLLEQHPDNLPIVQGWVDKWFWRGYKVLSLVAMMMDYMLPKRIMSWKEAWEIYFVQAGGALFEDLGRYGLKPPKYHEQATAEADHVSHQNWNIFYNYTHAAAFHTWLPEDDEMDWLAEKYPNSFNQLYRPRYEHFRQMEQDGNRFYNNALPQLCNTCQIPMGYTEPNDPTKICYRESMYKGERYHFCSDGCKDIFDNEPAKFAQSWLPVHQIFQGNCGGADLEDVLKWYHINLGADNLDQKGSPEQKMWDDWQRQRDQVAAQ
ncbi:MAG: phenol 2-monooxygenase [Rhodobacterales bacterium]|nr:MAG: phenol 2-monooxygenase [Rhodobacterales bacterium]